SWQADRVGPLLPGIVEMAWETCRRTREAGVEKPIFVAPIVWKLRFRGAVHETLRREMAHIERRLDLQSGSRLTVEERLAVLQQNLLRRQWDRLELSPTPPELDGVRYFTAQRTAVDAILRELDRRYGPLEADLARIQHAVRRSLRTQSDADPLTVKRDRALLAELSRLMGFAPELYDRPALTQEQIAETLKRTRGMLLTRGRRDGMHNLIPIAAGPRDAFVRVPEPLAIHEAYSEEGGEEHRSALLRELRERMQRSLDGLLEAIRPAVTRHARQNPLHTGAGR
ncbi:MAG TPA: hypothetical protein VEY91_06415, partial [Candidatus Limnocylindria bacterium]|nr:hypothetical protein [Candidatus Limnocylindria bacterium]